MSEPAEITGEIKFNSKVINTQFPTEKSVLELALENGVEINHSCGGNGTCTTCRVFIECESGELPVRGDLELDAVEGRGFNENERLACQTTAMPGINVLIP